MRCIKLGVPKIAGNINYTSHQQIVQGPGVLVLLSEVNHEARMIPIDGRPHLPRAVASNQRRLARALGGDHPCRGNDQLLTHELLHGIS